MSRPAKYARTTTTQISAQQKVQQKEFLDRKINELSLDERQVAINNPHIAQVFVNNDNMASSTKKYHYNVGDMSKFLEIRAVSSVDFNNLDQKTYTRRNDEIKTTVHNGQRKLLLCEYEFLAKYSKPGDHIVYLGSSPGTHLLTLIPYFPNLNWVLIDPTNNVFSLQKPLPAGIDMKRVKIIKSYFTMDIGINLYNQLPNKKVLIISDIRSLEYGIDRENEDINTLSEAGLNDKEKYRNMSKEEKTKYLDDIVICDMNLQAMGVYLLKPRKSMLKFRLPYLPGKTKYFDGTILFQIWAGETSSETRLIITDIPQIIEYDNSTYENILFNFNTVLRVTNYCPKHECLANTKLHDNVIKSPLISTCYCFDCMSERYLANIFPR